MAANFIQSADISDAKEETVSEPLAGQFMYLPLPPEGQRLWGQDGKKMEEHWNLPEDEIKFPKEYLTSDQAKEYLETNNGDS